eukprot:Tbor_TRINITY_DN5282_c2_g2::TRINITY_DN5282_c2_g2_i1::g.16562::m.16562
MSQAINGNGPEVVKIVFLDCDGVISPFTRSEVFAPSKMLLLKNLIERASKKNPKIPVMIVLSSSWRATEFGRKEVAKQLATYDIPPHIGCTPLDPSSPRSVEILRWIEENESEYKVVNFVALDDINLPALAPDRKFFEKHAIVTNGSSGLTEADVDRAVEMLDDSNNI